MITIAKFFIKENPFIFIFRFFLSVISQSHFDTDRCEEMFFERVKIDVLESEGRIEKRSTETVTGFRCVSYRTKIGFGDEVWPRPTQ